MLTIAQIIFFGCASLTGEILKDPEVQLTTVEITNVSLKDVSLNLKLSVNNPNPIPLNLKSVNYSLQFSGIKVTEGVFDKGIDIPAVGVGELIIPLKFEYNAIGSLIDGFMKKNLTRAYEISGSANLGLFSIPFAKKGEVDLGKK